MVKKKQAKRLERYVVIAQNLTLNKEQWRGKFDFLENAFDACYKLATSDDWSESRTSHKIDFIVFDNHLYREVDRYHNK